MKIIYKFVVAIFMFFLSVGTSEAQEAELSNEYKKEIVHKLGKLVSDHYVFPQVGKKTENHLLAQLASGHFDQFTNNDDFAEALTETVQEINKDKHMIIQREPVYEAPAATIERTIEERLDGLSKKRNYNAGFHKVELLEGNVGYIDIRAFYYFQEGKSFADAYMKLIETTDAVIIDLSKNGGGDPFMVQYLCSYFFEGNIHLNSLYFREGDSTTDFFTLEEVGGTKMVDVPLFVMTSEKTFSGAEEFSYNMQTQKRATLVGQTTGGGANPGGNQAINENLSVFIPTGKAINPITKTNWEGAGVIPDIKTPIEHTYNKTYELAKEAASDYRNKEMERYTKMYLDLHKLLEQYESDNSYQAVLQSLRSCNKAGILAGWQINALGYEYLMNFNKIETALAIFKSNVVINPSDPNAYDSYAETLLAKGSIDEAIENYQTAVDLASLEDDGNLALYKENLAKAKEIKK